MACKAKDQIQDSRRGPILRVRLAKPVGQHAVLGYPVQDAICPYDCRVDGPGQQ